MRVQRGNSVHKQASQGRVVLRIGRWIGSLALVAVVAPSWGCAHGPRSFRKVEDPAPMVRARAIGLGAHEQDSRVLPALVARLSDSDPVVRLVAHEELRKRTGCDFGYVPWSGPEERAVAVERWRDWVDRKNGRAVASPLPPLPPSKRMPVATAARAVRSPRGTSVVAANSNKPASTSAGRSVRTSFVRADAN